MADEDGLREYQRRENPRRLVRREPKASLVFLIPVTAAAWAIRPFRRTEILRFQVFSGFRAQRDLRKTGLSHATRTLKEQLLWVQHFETVEELRQALVSFAARHNASWLRQRHGYKTPDQIRAEQKGLEPEAATGVKMAA